MAKNLGYSEKPAIYWFRDSERNIIYIGSTNNLSRRLQDHRKCIKSPEHHHSSNQKKLYDYLRSNNYTIHYYYCENYRSLEKQLIMKYKPKFNKIYTVLLEKVEYQRKWRNEHPEYQRKWRNEHPEYYKNYYKNHKKDKGKDI